MVVHVSTPRNRQPLPKPELQQKLRKITLAQALQAANRYQDAEMAKWVKLNNVKRIVERDGRPAITCETVTSKPNTPPQRGHRCSVRPFDGTYKGKISSCPAVVFDCNCSRWLFVWEFAMWYRGAARMLRSNGEYPEVTNPQLKIGLCKHLIVLAQYCLRRNL